MTNRMGSLVALLPLLLAHDAWPAEPPAMRLEQTIPLGAVRGRIDHLAADPARGRVFVAELGNDTVGVVDLAAGNAVRTLTGFQEPQGIGYEPSTDTVFIAGGGDGIVRILRGSDLQPIDRVALGSDADNVRIDRSAGHVLVGHGDGGVAVIDPHSRRTIGDVPLREHPEGFQITADGTRMFVNVPRAREIAVVDLRSARQTDRWPTESLASNFPMAIDEPRQRLFAVFRQPAVMSVYRLADGKRLAMTETCGDADDVFVDPDRDRVYVVCGEGFIDVLDVKTDAIRRIERVRTAQGARTGLLVPEWNRLVIAVPARGPQVAALWIFALGDAASAQIRTGSDRPRGR